MVTMGVRGGRPIHRQLLRGVGFTVALLFSLSLLAVSASFLLDSDEDLSAPRRIAVAATWIGIVAALAFTWRRLRRWSERPRWLVPAAAVIALAGLTPAVVMKAPPQAIWTSHCIPVVDAWRPVMAPPSTAERAFVAAHPKPTPAPLQTITHAQLRAFDAAFNAWASTKPHIAVEEYTYWQYGAGSCAAPSRTDVSRSAAGLGVGAAALTLLVRRRRTD